jgi:LysM repeat protein
MRFAAAIFSAFLALSCAPELTAQALQVDLEEFKRLAGDVADLRDANRAQQTRIAALQKEVDNLRSALRESQERSTSKMGDFATREDLKKIVEQIKEMDERRDADKKLILDEFENLAKALAQTAKAPKRREPENEVKNSEPEKPIEGTFLEYVVQPGDGSLSEILSKYNAELQKQGRPSVSLRQIAQANPKLKPDRIYVGQKIQLPVPDKKK